MKTTAIQKMIRIFEEPFPLEVLFHERLEVAQEARGELISLLDEAAWGNAAAEEVTRLKAEREVKKDKDLGVALAQALWALVSPYCRHSYKPNEAPGLCMIHGNLAVCEYTRCPIVNELMVYLKFFIDGEKERNEKSRSSRRST